MVDISIIQDAMDSKFIYGLIQDTNLSDVPFARGWYAIILYIFKGLAHNQSLFQYVSIW